MALRSLYLVLGIMIGAVWIAVSAPNRLIVQKIVQPISTFVDEPISINDPAPMTAGYDKPRRLFIDERLLRVPLNWSWNYIPTDSTEGIANWLTYGAVGAEAQNYVLGYQFPGKLGFHSSGVRSEISDHQMFKNKKIKLNFFGKNQKLETSLGTVATVSFGYKHNGLTKICKGYLSDAKNKDFKIEGYLCGKAGEIPSNEKLACLINSIKLYDQAYWVEPDSGKASRATCNFVPDKSLRQPAGSIEQSNKDAPMSRT